MIRAPRLSRCALNFILLVMGLSLLALSAPGLAQKRSTEDFPVLYAQIEGPITPAQVDLLNEALQAVKENNAKLLLLRLDTPGGLVESMREMIRTMLNAPAPVAVWVGPQGARAASAGVFLVAASNLAGMSPQSTIGAASPVQTSGEDVPSTMEKKVKNDLISLVRSVAGAHGRNLDWYTEAVEEAVSITSQEAVMERVVELIALDPEDFLVQASARGVPFKGSILEFDPANARIIEYEPSPRYTFLAWLLHPQIAYLLLLGGMAGLFFELTTPGAILPGVFGGICLLLGLYALSVLPTNVTGVMLILLSLVFFILEAKVTSYGMLSVAAITALVFGSVILFDTKGGFPGVSLGTIFGVVALLVSIMGVCFYLITKALRRPAASGKEAMIGIVGEVRSWSEGRGKVFAHGTLWAAVPETPDVSLAPGAKIRVTQVRGLTLHVAPENENS